MKRFISILIALSMLMGINAAAYDVITLNSSQIRQEFLQTDIDHLFEKGGIFLLEYDFIAGEENGGVYFLTKGDSARFCPMFISGKNNEIWYECNTYTSPAYWNPKTDAVQPLELGERYSVVSVLRVADNKDTSKINTYVNGALVRVNKGTGIYIKGAGSNFYSVLRTPKGTHCTFTPLNIESLTDFDYSPYLVRVESENSNIEVTAENNAVFKINLKENYTADEFISSLSIPEGAKASLFYGRHELKGSAAVLTGSRLVIQSKNRKQTLEYKITSQKTSFTSEGFSVDYENAQISGIGTNIKISEFVQEVKLKEGFAYAGIYYKNRYVKNENAYIADGMSLLIENEGSYSEYMLDANDAEGVITSNDFCISNNEIYGVLKGIPVYKFREKLVLKDGYSINGIYDAENNEITDKIIEDATLKIGSEKGELIYNIFLDNAYLSDELITDEGSVSLNAISDVTNSKSFIISGSVTPMSGEYKLSLHDLYSEAGEVVRFSADGTVYFWKHKADLKWQAGEKYDFKIVTDGYEAQADVFVNGEKILNNISPSWLEREKNAVSLEGNIAEFGIERVYSADIYEEEKKVYNENFKLLSENFCIKENSVLISKKLYTADEILSKIQPTNGARAELYFADGKKAEGSSMISDGMYILLSRGESEKRYYLKEQDGGIVPVTGAKLYKNEISAETELRNNFSLPMLSREASTDLLRLGKNDKLVVSMNVSNCNSYPVKLSFFAAGYDENGCITAVSVSDENGEIAAYTDGHNLSVSLDTKNLENAKVVKLYLWDGGLVPVKTPEILAPQSSARIDSLLDYDETNNDFYRTEIGTKTVSGKEVPQLIINSALSKPNYKGLIFAENGKDDIRLTIKVDKTLIPAGKAMGDYRTEITITDSDGEIMEKSTAENIADKMNVTFSSGKLSLGDYTLRVSLVDKETGKETDFNIHPLRKRSGEISSLSSYVDEYGRFIKNGEPEFYIGIYGDSYENPGQIALFEHSGIDGVQLYSGRPKFENNKMTSFYSEEWYDAVYKSGMDFWPTLAVYYNNGYDNIFFELNEEEDDGRVMERIMSFLRNKDSVGGYYIADENPGTQRDRVDWHNDIISSYDLTKPTFYMHYVGSNYFAHNSSSDIVGVDNYPVKFERDDPGLKMDTLFAQLRESIVNKPVWVALQCANRAVWYSDGISETAKGEAASEKQLRNMAMQAVTKGATGLWWYSYNSLLKEVYSENLSNEAVMIRNRDEIDLLKRPLEVSKLFKKWEHIIMSCEETARVELSGESIDYIVKSYNGKTYIFAVNPGLDEKKVTFTVDGAKTVKDIYTGVPYSVNENGSFSAVLGNIDIAVFEIEHSLFLSHNSELSNISFSRDSESFVINYDGEGTMTIYVPSGTEKVKYSACIGEKAQLCINGNEAKKEGTVAVEDMTFSVIAEDGSVSEYPVKFIKEQ